MDSAHKAERLRLRGRGRSSLFSIYLTWLQYAANYHRNFDCLEIIQRSDDRVKGRQPGVLGHVVHPLTEQSTKNYTDAGWQKQSFELREQYPTLVTPDHASVLSHLCRSRDRKST